MCKFKILRLQASGHYILVEFDPAPLTLLNRPDLTALRADAYAYYKISIPDPVEPDHFFTS